VAVTLFFLKKNLFVEKRQQDEDLARNRHVRTQGTDPGSCIARVEDVREETKETARCFFNDLWGLNKDRGRGAPSKEFLSRVRSRDVLVASYVTSYDVSNNPTVVEGESIQSVKSNRNPLVEQWSHCSSGGTEEL
jgi:hypothetical protein